MENQSKKRTRFPIKSEHAKTWHIDDPEAPDGGERYNKAVVRRVFSPEYKLAILAEYDGCTESGQKGALLRREGLYSSLITDWRRQHRQGLLKAALGRSDAGRPSLQDNARLRAENERLRNKLAQAEVIIGVQGKVHALLEEISKSAATDE
jgi:transposase